MKLFNILLDPDQENNGGGEPPVTVEDKAAELDALKQSVQKLEEVVRKERELKDEADRKAREAAKAAADAGKTAEERYADQMRELAQSNESLRLEVGRERAVRDALTKLESEGYEVDSKNLNGLLAVTSMSPDNVTAVVNTVVESLKRPKSTQVATQIDNPQPQAKKLEWGKLSEDDLTAPWVGKQPDLKI